MEKTITISYSEYEDLKRNNSKLTEENFKLKDAFCFTDKIGITHVFTKEEIHDKIKTDHRKLWLDNHRFEKVLLGLFDNKRFKRRNLALYLSLDLKTFGIKSM